MCLHHEGLSPSSSPESPSLFYVRIKLLPSNLLLDEWVGTNSCVRSYVKAALVPAQADTAKSTPGAYFNALLISMSCFNTSVKSSGNPMPFSAALREKYCQTSCSIEVGRNTFALSGM